MDEKRFSKEDFDSIFSRVPRLCVDIVIKNDQGVILTKRSIQPYIGCWHFPGGTVFKDEKLEQAAKRLAKEELGVNINIEKNLGVIEYLGNSIKNEHAVAVVLLANILSGEIKGSWQAQEVKFFTNIPKVIIPEVGNFLRENFKME